MTNTSSMPRYRVDRTFLLASDASFRFVNLEKKHRIKNKNREQVLNDIGGKTSPTWIIMSVVGLFAAIGFGVYGAFNAQSAIAGLVDPMGEGNIQPEILLIIGASISIVGMIFGHLIYEGIYEGIETDIHTGKKTLTSKIWLSVVGLVGSIVYVCYQFYLVKAAGVGAGVNETSSLSYIPYVVAGIAILELLIGAFILHKAFGYIVLFVINMLLGSIVRRMNVAARLTNDSYRQYIQFVDTYNFENSAPKIEREGNPNIRQAIAYYSGVNLQPSKDQPDLIQDKDLQASDSNEENSVLVNNSFGENNEKVVEARKRENQHEQTEKIVEEFINDTTDQDLTV